MGGESLRLSAAHNGEPLEHQVRQPGESQRVPLPTRLPRHAARAERNDFTVTESRSSRPEVPLAESR
jgi:hypothetical protein